VVVGINNYQRPLIPYLVEKTKLYLAKRPAKRSALFFFVVAALLLAACGTRVSSVNWPGLAAEGNTVYVAYGPGVLAYDVEAGEQVWSFPTEAQGSLQFYAAPSVENDLVVIGDYGAAGGMFSPKVTVSLYALEERDAGTLSTVWVADEAASDRIVAPPLQTETQVFVGTADNEILALDAESGVVQWTFLAGHSIWAQPLYQDGVVYVASLDKNLYALDAENGSVLWQSELGGSIANQPVIDGDKIYVGSFDKKLHALDRATGEEQWTAEATDWVWASPAVANGVVYYADIKGNVYTVSAESGESQWHQQVDGSIQATPVVVDDTVYVALIQDTDTGNNTGGALVALSTEDGQEQWREVAPGPLFATPVVVGDSIVVALQSDEALLMIFDLAGGNKRTFIPQSSE
jgi:outer membrane protein assembly factor BamB